MSGAPELPDLATLTGEEKDRLVHYLWDELRKRDAQLTVAGTVEPAANAGTEAATGVARRPGPLGEQLRDAGSARRGRVGPAPTAPAKLGRGLGWLGSTPVIALVGLVATAFLVDAGVGLWQQRVLAERSAEAEALETVAFNRMYVELVSAVPLPDGESYRVTLSMTSIGDAPLYVMLEPPRVFVQSGLAWREVPSRDPQGRGARVVELAGTVQYEVDVNVDFTGWTQLIPGYMHVRVDSPMLVGRSRDAADGIAERRNTFYVYLKPHGADDDSIRRQSGHEGAPPDFIRMPPH
jgi:hypothetical protein